MDVNIALAELFEAVRALFFCSRFDVMAKFSHVRCGLLIAVALLAGCAVNTHDDRSGTTQGGEGKVVTPKPAPAPPENRVVVPPPAPVPEPPLAPTGSYQDRQEQLLRARVAGSGILVQRNGENIKVVLPGNTVFAPNSEQIEPRFVPILENIAQILKEYEKTTVNVKGYTDATGSFEHNQHLSERRAQSVGGFFTQHQVAAPRVRTAGYGPRWPVAGNDSDAGRARNRRVEIDLSPLP